MRNTTIALMANHYAIKHLQREIRLERLLSWMPKHRRILTILEEQVAILTDRESQLGHGARRKP